MWVCKLFLLPLAMIVIASGCATEPAGPKTYPVTGVVTFDGKPLATGSIVFDPADGQGQGQAGTITAGQFKMESCAGSMKVSITASSESGKTDEYGEAVYESLLPRDKYDVNSKLTAEVTAEGPNSFTFELTSGAD
jgi:hypothetical protein